MGRTLARRVDRASLEDYATTYVARFSTTRAHLRRLMLRQVGRAPDEADKVALKADVDSILDGFSERGILDDARFAESKVRSLVNRGVSKAGISARLAAKGVGRDDIRSGLEAAAEEGDPTRRAAIIFARKRRLGPFRPEEDRAAERNNDLKRLGRAGFPFDVARWIVDSADVDALSEQ